MKGYINIAYGLKIITGDGKGNINPKYELNREDTANMIYNYIFNQ
ncbi:S-layer homology domain-containing protein [Tissierella sp.]